MRIAKERPRRIVAARVRGKRGPGRKDPFSRGLVERAHIRSNFLRGKGGDRGESDTEHTSGKERLMPIKGSFAEGSFPKGRLTNWEFIFI